MRKQNVFSDLKRIWANLYVREAMMKCNNKSADRPTTKPNLEVARRLAAVNRFLTPFTTLVAINDDLSRSRFGYHEVVSQLTPALTSLLTKNRSFYCFKSSVPLNRCYQYISSQPKLFLDFA